MRVCCYRRMSVSLENVLDVCCLVVRRTCAALLLLAIQREVSRLCRWLRVSKIDAQASAGRLHESASRSLRCEIEDCFPVTGALLTRACVCVAAMRFLSVDE